MSIRCVIVDYGMGNLRSIQHKLKNVYVEARIDSTSGDIASADLLIFPGVGHSPNGLLVGVLRKKLKTLFRLLRDPQQFRTFLSRSAHCLFAEVGKERTKAYTDFALLCFVRRYHV